MIERTLERLVGSVVMDSSCLPSWSVALQIFALPLEHTRFNLACCGVVFAWIGDIFDSADWEPRINEVFVIVDKSVPFTIFWHGKRARLKLFKHVICFIGFSLDNPSICTVSLLDFTYNNRLKLPTRTFKI